MASHLKAIRPQLSLKTAMVLIVVLAIGLGWYASVQDAKDRIRKLLLRVAYLESEVPNSKTRADLRDDSESDRRSTHGALSSVRLHRVNLRQVKISAGDSAMQRSQFIECDLRDAMLSGQVSAFQGVTFDQCNLSNAKLSGESASFQFASFVGANLSGAVLSGKSSSFQAATFENAKLIGAKLMATESAFQGMNLEATQFQGADLSAVEPGALESCYFLTPPTYDDRTVFPKGFDPVAQNWTRSP